MIKSLRKTIDKTDFLNENGQRFMKDNFKNQIILQRIINNNKISLTRWRYNYGKSKNYTHFKFTVAFIDLNKPKTPFKLLKLISFFLFKLSITTIFLVGKNTDV